MREIVELTRRVADLERRLAGSQRRGVVEEVDPISGRVRLRIGEGADGEPYLSPWVPYAQMAGGLKIHAPPTKGQQMALMAEGGDPRQGVAIPTTWSNTNANPGGTAEANVISFGAFTISFAGDALVISGPRVLLECGGSTFELTGDGLRVAAPDYDFL